MSSEAITRNDLTSILNEVLPPFPSILKASASITATGSDATATISLASGYDKTNTLIIGTEFSNSGGTIVNVTGTKDIGQYRWTAAGTGIYVLFSGNSFVGGTASVYYIKCSAK